MSRLQLSLAALALAALVAALTPSVAHAAHQPGRVAFCQGHRATITGGRANNYLAGTKHRDVIVSGGGQDTILGGKGNDLICAGHGQDDIDGGQGQDVVYGGRGNHDLCWAPTAREHRLHHGCEVHLTAPSPPGARAALHAARPFDTVAGQCASNACFGGIGQCYPNGRWDMNTFNQGPQLATDRANEFVETIMVMVDAEPFGAPQTAKWTNVGGPYGPYQPNQLAYVPTNPSNGLLTDDPYGNYGWVYFRISTDGVNFGPWVWRNAEWRLRIDQNNLYPVSYICGGSPF
jgi:RTX calcium-binding nonapeptide repeat (4 copies)